MGEAVLSPAERFWAKVDKTDGCWLWTGTTNNKGYGQFRLVSGLVLAHRFAYESLIGPLASQEQVDHDRRCSKRCVNPFSHWADSPGLRLTTNKQNNENRIGANSNNQSSGIRGVSWDKKKGKWSVNVTHNGERHWGGYFNDLKSAGAVAVSLRNSLYTHNDIDRMSRV